MYTYNEKELVTRYQKYFDNWDTYAAVRSKPNTYRFEQYHLNTESYRTRVAGGLTVVSSLKGCHC